MIWDIQLPDALLRFFNLFRTSGRFIWPVFYFVAIFTLGVLIRNIRYPVPVLALILLLQFFDLQPVYQEKRLEDFTRYEARIEGEFWQAAADKNEHLVLLPGTKLPLAYEPFAVYAVHNDQTLNLGYFARSDNVALQAYSDRAWNELITGKLDPQTIYVIIDPDWVRQAKISLSASSVYFCVVDDYTLFFSGEHGWQ